MHNAYGGGVRKSVSVRHAHRPHIDIIPYPNRTQQFFQIPQRAIFMVMGKAHICHTFFNLSRRRVEKRGVYMFSFLPLHIKRTIESIELSQYCHILQTKYTDTWFFKFFVVTSRHDFKASAGSFWDSRLKQRLLWKVILLTLRGLNGFRCEAVVYTLTMPCCVVIVYTLESICLILLSLSLRWSL